MNHTANQTKAPSGFMVNSALKVALLSVSTFGLYELYWFWINWNVVKEKEKTKIWPIGRALFSVIFCFPLFKKILSEASETSNPKKFTALQLAFIYIFLSFLGILPNPYWILGIMTFYPLMEIQSIINKNAKTEQPKAQNTFFSDFSTLELSIIVIGSILLAVGIASAIKG
ncbi:MAG: hypothetical protein HYY51_04780 [Candidatus Magasanikbacteria bacterium]|nr:hypothetical protein [Candidatus Magasanikbacteria bacterium]